MTTTLKTAVRSCLSIALLVSAHIAYGACDKNIQNRIEYKLNRILRDVEKINEGNTGNCTPITQEEINQGGGTYTILHSGLYCVNEDVTGHIQVAPGIDSVAITLENHIVNAGGRPSAISADGNAGLKVFNGTITGSTVAAILITDYSAVDLFDLYIHDYTGDAIRIDPSSAIYVHDIVFEGGPDADRALNFVEVDEVLVERCDVTDFPAASVGLVTFATSECSVIRDVNICDATFTEDGAGIVLTGSSDMVIDRSNVHSLVTSSTDNSAHGILLDTCSDSEVVNTQVHNNQNAGIELVGLNTAVVLLENVASLNDVGFEFAATSTADCCLVQDNRALSNKTNGFVHAPATLTTTFIGNEAQCNGAVIEDNYLINGGSISLQELSWADGNFYVISGNGDLGARYVNLVGAADVP